MLEQESKRSQSPARHKADRATRRGWRKHPTPSPPARSHLIETHRNKGTASRLYFDSIAQASAELKVPPSVLRKAKKLGAPGFRSGRVYTSELLPWLRDHQSAKGAAVDKESAQLEVLLQQARRLKLRNDREEGQVIPRATIVELHAKLLGQIIPRVEQILTNEYPSLVVGLDVPQIRIKGRQVFDGILETFRHAGELFRGW